MTLRNTSGDVPVLQPRLDLQTLDPATARRAFSAGPWIRLGEEEFRWPLSIVLVAGAEPEARLVDADGQVAERIRPSLEAVIGEVAEADVATRAELRLQTLTAQTWAMENAVPVRLSSRCPSESTPVEEEQSIMADHELSFSEALLLLSLVAGATVAGAMLFLMVLF